MTSPAPIPNHVADGPAAIARQTFDRAQRRRAAAAAEAQQAHERLVAADEDVRRARRALRDAGAGATPGADDMIGMGYFADEVMIGEAA